MTLLLHETHLVYKEQILNEGLTYTARNTGRFKHGETDTLNELIDKHKPPQFTYDRSKAVFFSCERDYIKFGNNKFDNLVSVDSKELDPQKLFVFPSSIAAVILKHFKSGRVNVKTEVVNYWNTGFPFQFYDENHLDIEERFKSHFKSLGYENFEYCPEILYFDEVPAGVLSSYTKTLQSS
jgi:hypothetical protein